jgi:hypothetical protein
MNASGQVAWRHVRWQGVRDSDTKVFCFFFSKKKTFPNQSSVAQ